MGVHGLRDGVAGGAGRGGPVLISWFDQPEEANGMNVVIHEFAHKLDMLNGPPDGLPPPRAPSWGSATAASITGRNTPPASSRMTSPSERRCG